MRMMKEFFVGLARVLTTVLMMAVFISILMLLVSTIMNVATNDPLPFIDKRVKPLTEVHTVTVDGDTHKMSKQKTDDMRVMLDGSEGLSRYKSVNNGTKFGTLKVTDKESHEKARNYTMYKEKARIQLIDKNVDGLEASVVIEGKDVAKFTKLIKK